MHPITMNLPCGRHVWFSAQKLMLAHSLLVSQVPLWILFHSAARVVFSACSFVGATVVVSRFPKCLSAVFIGPYRWNGLSSCQSPPTPGIKAISPSPRLRPSVATFDEFPLRWVESGSSKPPPTPWYMEPRVSSTLRSSVPLKALAWFPSMDPALFVCVCFVAPSITCTVNESFLRGGGLDGSSVVWPDLESVPMMVSPIIRQLAPQSDGDMLVLICTMASFLSSFFFRDVMLTDCLAFLAQVIYLRAHLMRLSRLFILVDLLPVGRALLRCLGQFRLVHLLWRQDSLRLFPSGLLPMFCCPLLWYRKARLSPCFFLLGCLGLPFVRFIWPFLAA
jgi:hypothetical protein